ncbi:MAG: ATP-binding cassette domain-containing protein [Actinobacteria bacterium]|nr:ATP-binding cassette domain-containing protein [Actinomycetota bacterium]
MLETTGLTVDYERIRALRDADLRVSEGDIVGILGPNGAGKSTLLSAIVGLVRPSSGTISFQGQSLLGMKTEDIARLGVALVPEGRHVFRRLSVIQNLMLGASVRRSDRSVSSDAEELMDRFPVLAKKRNDSAGSLSGGQQQQLVIARALLSKPRLLVLDEPSLGLDPKMVHLVFDILRELGEEGLALLIAEQNTVRTLGITQRVYVLRTGSVVWAGPSDDLEAQLDFKSEYLGAESVVKRLEDQ